MFSSTVGFTSGPKGTENLEWRGVGGGGIRGVDSGGRGGVGG